MKKALLIIVPLAGAVTVGVIANRKKIQEQPDMWARMEQKMAQMPETFPPRMMFDNIAVIREQTTRILELLEQDAGGSAASTETPVDGA